MLTNNNFSQEFQVKLLDILNLELPNMDTSTRRVLLSTLWVDVMPEGVSESLIQDMNKTLYAE